MPIKILYLFIISFFYFISGFFFVPFSWFNLTCLFVFFILVQFSFYAWSFYDFYSSWKLTDLFFPLGLNSLFLFLSYFFLSEIFLLQIGILFYFFLIYLIIDTFLRLIFKGISYLLPQKKLIFLLESSYALDFMYRFLSYQNQWEIVATFRYKEKHFPPSYKEVLWENWNDIILFLENYKIDLLVYERPLEIEGLSLLKIPIETIKEVKTISLADFIVKVERKVPIGIVDAFWISKFITDGLSFFNSLLKRMFDILFTLVLLPILLPLIVITAILTFITSRGPIFYSQIREGLKGKHFRIYKFRSMRVDAEKQGAQWAQKSDNRVTFWGKIMRKLRLDELPQIWNVLIGDMSFVGPRPERPEFTKILKEKIPFYELRHNVKPGLTGWAQVNYPYGASIEDAWKKTEYDLFYVHSSSFWQDIKILIRTAQVVIMGKGQ